MIACATQSVTTSASVILRRAFSAPQGRRSSAVQNTAISSRSRSASIVAPWVDGAIRHRRLRPAALCLLRAGPPTAGRGTTHLAALERPDLPARQGARLRALDVLHGEGDRQRSVRLSTAATHAIVRWDRERTRLLGSPGAGDP